MNSEIIIEQVEENEIVAISDLENLHIDDLARLLHEKLKVIKSLSTTIRPTYSIEEILDTCDTCEIFDMPYELIVRHSIGADLQYCTAPVFKIYLTRTEYVNFKDLDEYTNDAPEAKQFIRENKDRIVIPFELKSQIKI